MTLLAAAVIVIGGLAAAASKFAPQYFGAGDSEPTPAAVLAALRSYAQDELPGRGAWGEIDEAGVVRLAAFDTPDGRVIIYAAPLEGSSGFCSVQAIDEVGGVVSCGVVSTWISWLLVGSTLPATSQARYLTVVVLETLKGPL